MSRRSPAVPTTLPGRHEQPTSDEDRTPKPKVPSNLDAPAAEPVAPEAIMDLAEIRIHVARKTLRASGTTKLAFVMTKFGPFVRILQGSTVRLLHPSGVELTPKAGQ